MVADAAEAAGATRLLALIDGKALIVNVVTRTVEGEFDPAGKAGVEAVLTGVDSAVVVPGGDEEESGGGVDEAIAALSAGIGAALSPPGAVANRSLAELLAAVSGGG